LSGEIVDSSLPSESSFQSGSGGSESADKTSIFDEIDRQMSDLQNEIDRYGLLKQNDATTNGGDASTNYESSGDETPPPPPDFNREPSPPPLPPPCVMPGTTPPTSNSTYMLLTKPSLPEPEGPPPPPPVQNGYAFNTPHIPPEVRNPLGNLAGKNSDAGNANSGSSNNGIMKKPKEPIYESIKPRPEPLGGPADDEAGMEYGFTMTQQNPRPANGRPPLPQVPGRNQNQNQNGIYGGKTPLEIEREARRMNRVKRELERIQVGK
jgi:hypothetical protein